MALVAADTAGRWPYREDLTADFLYLRLHGDAALYASGYNDAALDRWAARIDAWASGSQPIDAALTTQRPARQRATRDVYCYFDNDIKVHAPYDAAHLMLRLGLGKRAGEFAHRRNPVDSGVQPPPEQRKSANAAVQSGLQPPAIMRRSTYSMSL